MLMKLSFVLNRVENPTARLVNRIFLLFPQSVKKIAEKTRKMKFKPILSSSQLKRLNDHKYSCTSSSLLEPFLQPWWNWVVSQLPVWLAPNLITITGLAVNIITSLVLIYLNPDGKQEVKS